MESLVYALNATVPVFLLMMAGVGLRKAGIMTESFARGANGYVFKVALPISLFVQLADISFYEVWDTRFVLFCLGATVLSILIGCGVARVLIPEKERGEFTQASYRSSASLVGMAFMENLYGKAGMGSLMILGSVPLYNISAVLILSLMKPGGKLGRGEVRKTLVQVATNPILLGTLLGFFFSLLPFEMPHVVSKTLSDIGKTATPIGLMAMGAQMERSQLKGHLREAALASFFKLAGFVLLMLPLAVLMGFRREKLVAILVMLGSATTVTAYIMARSMGHEGAVTQATVLITTVLSAFTLTLYLTLLRLLSLV